jgi:hypothetical protein
MINDSGFEMTKRPRLSALLLCCTLTCAELACGSLAASARDGGRAAAGGSTADARSRISLYVQPVAYMMYCGIEMNDEAVGATLAAVGLQGTSISSVKSKASALVPQLEKHFGPGKFDFCKTAKTIPVVQDWTAKQ